MSHTTVIRPIRLAAHHRNARWTNLAACAGTPDPDHFYPEPGQTEETALAKAACATCPVKHDCLDEALDLNDRCGIRGGLNETERLPLHRHATLIRWDEQRVRDVLDGRPVALSRPERDSVITVAALLDLDERIWMPALGISRKYALDLLRIARQTLATGRAAVTREQRIAATLTPAGRAVAA